MSLWLYVTPEIDWTMYYVVNLPKSIIKFAKKTLNGKITKIRTKHSNKKRQLSIKKTPTICLSRAKPNLPAKENTNTISSTHKLKIHMRAKINRAFVVIMCGGISNEKYKTNILYKCLYQQTIEDLGSDSVVYWTSGIRNAWYGMLRFMYVGPIDDLWWNSKNIYRFKYTHNIFVPTSVFFKLIIYIHINCN